MKKILISIVLLVNSTIACLAQQPGEVVGIIDNDNLKITSPLTELKSSWQKQLKDAGITSPLAQVEIASGIDQALDDEKFYFLMGITEDKTTKIAVLLKLQEGKFFLAPDDVNSPLGTVICMGCDHGCNPKKERDWFCGGGCGLDCKKTVTVTVPE